MKRSKKRHMVIIKRFFSIVISIFFICNFSVNTSALTDVTHSAYEEDKLLDTTWYKGACLNSSPTCQKHILKFESVNELIDFFEKKLKITKSEKNSFYVKRYLEAGGLTALGVVAAKLILTWKNISAIGGVGLGFYVVQPLRNLASFIFEALPKTFYFLKEKFISKTNESTENKKGKISEASDLLLGNADDNILANEINQEIYARILEILKQKIIKKEYIGKDILIVSWDNSLDKPSFSIKFDTTTYPIAYEEDIEKYFKR